MFSTFRGLQAAAGNGGGSWTNWTGTNDGSNNPFTSGSFTSATVVGVMKLSSSQFVLFYTDPTNSVVGCVVGTRSGTSVVYGTPATLQSVAINNFAIPSQISICSHSATILTACWSAMDNGTGHNDIYAITISISGTTITPGILFQVTTSGLAAQQEPTDITPLSATTAAITYTDNGIINLIAISLSGTTITKGTATALSSNVYKRPSVVCYTAGKVLLVYNYFYSGSNQQIVLGQVINISGATIGTIGGAVNIDAFSITSANIILIDITVAVMSPSAVILSYIANNQNTGNYTQNASLISPSGNTFPVPTPVTINASSATSLTSAWLEPLGGVNAMVAYVNNFATVVAKIFTLNGSTIVSGSAVQIQGNSTPGGGQLLSMLDSTNVISCSTDGSGRAVTKVLKP